MIYEVTINSKVYEVEVEKGKANIVKVEAVKAPIVASAPAVPAAAPVPASAPAQAAGGSEIVKAPMPGTILGVFVSPGEKVKKGEVILVLEAMKMENEILASIDGVVKQVLVVKNSSVATGDVLVIFE